MANKAIKLAEVQRLVEWEGIETLETSGLLALLLGSDFRAAREKAAELLAAVGELSHLADFTPEGLMQLAGLSHQQSLRLLAAFELARRSGAALEQKLPAGPVSKELVAQWGISRLGLLEHEEVWVLTVDARARLRTSLRVGRGGAHGCALLPRDILTPVVRAGAAGFVLVHNHPSGDPQPSAEDLALTACVKQAGSAIGTPLLDHVIVARDDYRSLFESTHWAA